MNFFNRGANSGATEMEPAAVFSPDQIQVNPAELKRLRQQAAISQQVPVVIGKKRLELTPTKGEAGKRDPHNRGAEGSSDIDITIG